MTPKDKAEDLFVKHYELIPDVIDNDLAKEYAIQSSLITVDEVLFYCKALDTYGIQSMWKDEPDYKTSESYWNEIKKEIKNL